MTWKLESDGDDACVITEQTCSCSMKFKIDTSRETIVGLLRTLLTKPESRSEAKGAITVDRMRDGPRISAGGGSVTIPYAHVIPLIVGDVQ